MRAGELLKWIDSGEYERLLQNPEKQNQQPEIETTSNDKEEWNFLGSW